ncbi:hypothetical protein D9757_014846 [Collybiopsis confluens]|uniref:Ketosynthase family 3 (KS3) domain-containing protein n=1 Tax=Collybiopsis confluens TaxID=2823264 RepID=A0A8H5CA52_9AGAR|nr:hypothetical protein D9757_014846 [Collybiopsis confluens]
MSIAMANLLWKSFPPSSTACLHRFENTFEITEEPDYVVTLDSEARWCFAIQRMSSVSFRDRISFRELTVTGDIFVRDQLKNLKKVGSVEFQADDAHGNPVVAYLQRHGVVQGQTVPLANEGYKLTTTEGSTSFFSPLTNEPYSMISGDFNPIHINPYFSCYAGLPGTITHDCVQRCHPQICRKCRCKRHPERVLAYDVSFVGMVLPEFRSPPLLRITGQGSQEPGMGMDLYNSSPAARAVWDVLMRISAPSTLLYSEIVKDNPRRNDPLRWYQGQAIRQRYMDMSYDAMDKDAIHPNGLSFATQFAQIALVVTEKAAFEDMRSKGFVQNDCAFAGHSLGEYSALASIADVLAISALSMSSSIVIVNFNVEGQQMFVLESLSPSNLTNVLNYLKVKKIDMQVNETLPLETEGYIKLDRGFATIPLPVSMCLPLEYLWLVHAFPNLFVEKIILRINPDVLMASTSQLDRQAVRSLQGRQNLSYIILVELFGLPIRFTRPLDPNARPPLLTVQVRTTHRTWAVSYSTGMATRTLKAKYETQDDCVSLTRRFCATLSTRRKSTTYRDEAAAENPRLTLKPCATVAVPVAAASAPIAVAAAPAAPLPTSRMFRSSPLTFCSPLLLRIEEAVNEISTAKSIKDLVGAHLARLGLDLNEQMDRSRKERRVDALSRYTLNVPESPLRTGAASAGGGGGGGGAVINSEEFTKFQADRTRFAAQHIELYMRYLKRDSRSGEIAFDAEKANSAALQAKLDSIAKEHGDLYIDGIQPVFDPLKARHFDSSWNWVRQDALTMYFDIIFGRLTTVDREITARCIHLLNRADPEMLAYMQYHIDQTDPTKGANYKLAKEFGQQLIDNTRQVLEQPPVYKDVTFPTAPHTEVTSKGEIVYSEVIRENVRKLETYVEEMARSDTVSGPVNIQKVQDDVMKLWTIVKSQPEISQDQKNRIKALYEGVVRSLRAKGPETHARTPRSRRSSSQFLRPQISAVASVSADKVPLLHLKRKVGTNWEYSSNLTNIYLDILHEIATAGTTFKDKNALLTGVGKGSIGVEVVKGLLSGGAHVVITTSRYSRSTVEYYQSIFQTYGSRGSALTVVPFNQGSKQDVDVLVDYIYSTLGMDLDFILPFAGIPENGREIDGIDDKSELAHRIMLTNLLRILGAVKSKKASRQFVTRPTQVILPLSPNHGLFGNDGLYSESKISLETLFQRWASESWGEYLCLAGAVIGWTRGTTLMGPTNIVAHELESYGVRTFSAKEMAFNILGLMHPLLFSITQVEPIWADLNGGMDRLPDLADITTRIRTSLAKKSDLRRAIARDNAADFKVLNGVDAERLIQTVDVLPRANFRFNFPELESQDTLIDVTKLRGVLDLEKVMVITGTGEVGPWGSARTRWEMEARGEFTIQGAIEMAWIMGYIKHFNGPLKDGSLYVGWVDSKSGEPVDDKDVKGRYEKDILAHSGIRLIEPELFRGYDPSKKVFNQEVELIHDLEPIEVTQAEASKFKHQHGDKCDIWAGEGGQWFFKLKKGACVFVPKAFSFSRKVASQIPTGWYAGRYGIPDDIIAQTDPVALWNLVSTAEALNMSGITDPYELYQHVHPSEVGTSLGSGMGGQASLQKMFTDRRDEKEVQNDILQETFINTTAGWINLLLLSSSGPVKIPVGACATALQSIEIACDTILSGKAKVMIAGGFDDDISEEGSYEFAGMKATSDADKEFAMGREPSEMSRPTATTRGGFMEAQGTAVHIVMSAKTALELGCPVRGIIAFTSTSTYV